MESKEIFSKNGEKLTTLEELIGNEELKDHYAVYHNGKRLDEGIDNDYYFKVFPNVIILNITYKDGDKLLYTDNRSEREYQSEEIFRKCSNTEHKEHHYKEKCKECRLEYIKEMIDDFVKTYERNIKIVEVLKTYKENGSIEIILDNNDKDIHSVVRELLNNEDLLIKDVIDNKIDNTINNLKNLKEHMYEYKLELMEIIKDLDDHELWLSEFYRV